MQGCRMTDWGSICHGMTAMRVLRDHLYDDAVVLLADTARRLALLMLLAGFFSLLARPLRLSWLAGWCIPPLAGC